MINALATLKKQSLMLGIGVSSLPVLDNGVALAVVHQGEVFLSHVRQAFLLQLEVEPVQV